MSRMNSQIALIPVMAAAALLTSAQASAGVVTFDTADGYVLGASLSGQPAAGSPQWAGNGSLYTITSLGGGNGAAQSSDTDQTNFANVRFTPDAAFLGAADTTTAGQVFDFSFDLRSDQDATTSDFDVAHRIRIGGTDGTPIVDFQIFDNGRLQYYNGSAYSNVVNSNDNVVGSISDFGNRFVTVAGTIDFNTNTYDLTVDGVEQATGLGLFSTPSDFGQITLQWGTNSDDNAAGEYRQISIDNLSVAVPEPGSMALLTLSGLMLLRRRRNAN